MFQKSVNRKIESKQFLHLSENFKQWLETLGYHSHTVKLASWNIQEFFAFLERQGVRSLRNFNPHYLNQYLDYLQHRPNCNKAGSLSPGYINKHVTTLRWFSKYLNLTGKASIIINPEHFKTIGNPHYLTRQEIHSLYKAARDERNIFNQRDTAMLSVFYGCGLRASEGAALNTSDVLFEKELLYVRKGKGYRQRYVPINRQVRNDLQTYILNQRLELLNGGNNEALLLGRNGTRWGVAGMYIRMQRLRERAGEKLREKTFGIHILRHSIATHLLQSGMKLECISRFLGHKSLETTQKYTHLLKEGEC